MSRTRKVARLTSETSSSPNKTWWLNSFLAATPSTEALADPLLASANRPAAPSTGAAFLVRFRLDSRFTCDIGKTSRSPNYAAPETIPLAARRFRPRPADAFHRLSVRICWPLATPKHKGPSANPRALCSFQYATQDTLGSARAPCVGHGKGPVNAFAQGILNSSHLLPSRLRRANCVENAPHFPQ